MRTQFSMIVLAGLIGCSEKNPCDAYVEALCECNEAKCDDFKTQYQNADVNDKDTCAALLDDAKAADDPACEAGDTASGGSDTGDTGT